jgi:dihydroorotase
MKSLEAICVTSASVARQQVIFDEQSGLIVSRGDLGISREKLDYYFSDDCLLFAGMGDVHIHAREDVSGLNTYKEDFRSARAAMINGGVTHAGDMPNNPVPPIDDKSYEAKFHLAQNSSDDLWFYAGIGPGTSPLSYPVPYKVYMGPSVGELYFKDLNSLDEALARYKGQWVSFHCEDPVILNQHRNEIHHHLRRPPEAEIMATRDALNLIEKHQLKGKLCHYSTGEGLRLIREARARGVDVSIEATPQHLYFDINHLEPHEWSFMQMNPPMRFEKDREVLLEALKNGEIQYLATDHAPHTTEEKRQGTSGLTGLDSYGPFVSWLIQAGVSLQVIAQICSENPGDFFNQFLPSWRKLSAQYDRFGLGMGYLQPDYRANFTVINMNKPFKLTKENLKTKVGHSPFLGVTFPGQLAAVFIGGRIQ